MGWFEVGFEGALSVSVLAKVFFGSSFVDVHMHLHFIKKYHYMINNRGSPIQVSSIHIPENSFSSLR